MARRPSTPLHRDQILDAAAVLADADGLDGLSMRAIARALDVGAMSLYRHVRDKDDLLDGMVDRVHQYFPLPDDTTAAGARRSLRVAYLGAFDVLLAHPWAAGLALDRAALGPHRLRHTDRVVGALRATGCSLQGAHTAMHALTTHLFGFALQVHSTWAPGGELGPEATALGRGERGTEYPHLTAMLAEVSHEHTAEFTEILDLLLDGIAPTPARPPR